MWIAAAVFAFLVVFVLRRSLMTWQVSSGGTYFWVKRAPGQELVADRLEQLTIAIKRVLEEGESRYPDDPRLRNVRKRWSGSLAEVERSGDIAYSMNKNDVRVCVRSENGLEDFNTTMYVLLHELAHVATDEYGHSPEFWRNMRWFVELAESVGAYVYQDFEHSRTTFCGHRLGRSIVSCVKEKRCESMLQK